MVMNTETSDRMAQTAKIKAAGEKTNRHTGFTLVKSKAIC